MTQEVSHMRLGAMGLSHDVPCPDGWRNRRLRLLTRINKPAKIDLPPETEVSFVPMAAIGENGGIQLDQVKPLDEIGGGYTSFVDGDVVVAKITPCFENRKGAIAEGLQNGVAFGTTELHVVQTGEQIDQRFLFYLSISELFRNLGEGAMYGAGGQKRVPERFIKDFRAPVPPLSAQEKIAAFLDRKTAEIDILIAKKRRLLNLLAEKRTALITRAVTKGLNQDAPMKESGIEWLGEVPAHWEVTKFRWRCSVVSGQVDPRGLEYADLPLVAPDHIEPNTGRMYEVPSAEEQGAISGKYSFPEGTLLYSKIRPNLSKVCIVPFAGLCSADMYPIIPSKNVKTKYLFYQLLADRFRSYAVIESMRVAMPKLNRDSLSAAPIVIPPLHEQEQIIEQVDEVWAGIDRVSDKVKAVIRELEEYRSALITSAAIGQIQVA